MRRLVRNNIAVIAFCLAGAQTVFADAITISVLPSSQTGGLGSPLNVSLKISGLGNFVPPSLGAFDVNVAFDPTLLSFSNATFGDQLDPTGLGKTVNFATPSLGMIELFDLSLDSASQLNTLQPSSFILAGITFNAIAAGTSSLALSINALGDADGNPLSADLRNGSAKITNVTAIPEPSSLVLLALGLAVIAKLRSLKYSALTASAARPTFSNLAL